MFVQVAFSITFTREIPCLNTFFSWNVNFISIIIELQTARTAPIYAAKTNIEGSKRDGNNLESVCWRIEANC